jgi:hypothetical protein
VGGIFERFVGLETEYAVRFQPHDATSSSPSKFRLYESVIAALGRRVPAARAKHFKEGVFIANGGAVWFEAERPAAGGGLIEGATPECRGPREVTAYQLAQDQLLAQAAESARIRGKITLIKNDRDALGHVYGAQENYEATLAEGWRLLLWRAGLIALFPLAMLTWLMVFACLMATLVYFLVAALIYLPCRLISGGHERVSILLFGRDLTEGRDTCVHFPVWLEGTLQVVTRIVTGPLAIALFLLLQTSAFCGVRRKLLPFLISRAAITGAGLLDGQGRFHLADKAPAVNCVMGFGGIIGDRPVYTMGHFFKAVYAESWFSPREYAGLFLPRQRLQIAIGDSNMCETSQLLRVGTTLLVLDAIDAGFFGYSPQLRSPIRSLHAICADPTLSCAVPLIGEKPATALELQRFYYSACRAFVGSQPEAPKDAWEILNLWKHVLEELEQVAGDKVPQGLIGELDWVTKKYLLDNAAPNASWESQKKIDIRYHELSVGGYFELLRSAGLSTSLIDEKLVERATRMPPSNSPATMRGHYIREFGGSDERFAVNWKSISFGHGWRKRVVRLAQYSRGDSPLRRPRGGLRGRNGRRRQG